MSTPARLCLSLALVVALGAGTADANGRRIPYHGRLQGVSGAVTVSIELKSAATGGATVFGPELHSVVLDPDGRFFVSIGASERDACRLRSDLVENSGGEEPLAAGELPAWSEVAGAAWTSVAANGVQVPHSGIRAISPSTSGAIGAQVELAQSVDVALLAQTIDAGQQRFRFTARALRATTATSRTVVEFRGAASQVLASFDSGALVPTLSWQQLADERLAPLGTRSVRVRLLASRSSGATTDSYWDDLRLAPLPALMCDRPDGVADLDQVDPHALFVEVTVDDGTTPTVLFPRHRLEPAHHAATAAGEVAVGTVVMWWGLLANVPAGWELCDGALPTTPGATLVGTKPDLRARFARTASGAVLDPTASPVLAGSDTAGGGSSGGTSLSKAQLPNHTLPDTFSTSSMEPAHSHTVTQDCAADDDQNSGETETHYALGDSSSDLACPITLSTVPTHSHSLSSSLPVVAGSGQTHSHGIPSRDNRPAYLELFYIVRVK